MRQRHVAVADESIDNSKYIPMVRTIGNVGARGLERDASSVQPVILLACSFIRLRSTEKVNNGREIVGFFNKKRTPFTMTRQSTGPRSVGLLRMLAADRGRAAEGRPDRGVAVIVPGF
jgi:hypothetical protein